MIRFFIISILTYFSLHYLGFSTGISIGIGVASGAVFLIGLFNSLAILFCSIIYSTALCKLLAPELLNKALGLMESIK